jgi:Arc/MetJ-type ribon-helix-helix transcriptional regulator
MAQTQVVTRLDDQLAADLDGLVADGVVASRSEAVRIGLERLVDEHRRALVGASIVEAYRRQPQSEEELAGLEQSTRALVDEEPW